LDPNGFYIGYFREYVRFGKDGDLKRTKKGLIDLWRKDTTRFDIAQEIGKVCYSMREYEEAYRYYRIFMAMNEYYKVAFTYEYIRVAAVYDKMGETEKAKELASQFKRFADEDRTMYKHFHQMLYYAYIGDKQKAINHFQLFAKEKNFRLPVLMIPDDPMMDGLRDLPEFKSAMKQINDEFELAKGEMKQVLEEEELPKSWTNN
jgi:tetratricopeptide (TPR) repeat protein